MKLVVGLGNPGEKYEETRHNVGFIIVDKFANKQGVSFRHEKVFEADVADFFIGTEKIFLVKPTTFMNNSGKAIAALLTYYNVPMEDFVVIYDDLDLAVGKLRLRAKGSAGGHNGIKSVIAHLKTQEFNRVKVGIGRQNHGTSVISYVLGKFPKEQKLLINEAVDETLGVLEYFLKNKTFMQAMNKFN